MLGLEGALRGEDHLADLPHGALAPIAAGHEMGARAHESRRVGHRDGEPAADEYGDIGKVVADMGARRSRQLCGRQARGDFAGEARPGEKGELVPGGVEPGGENSGHLIFGDHVTTGDGVCAALNLLAVMKRTDLRLSQLAGCFTPSPQAQINVAVK